MKRTDPFELIENLTGIPYSEIPRSYEMIGKSIILRFNEDFHYDKRAVGMAFKRIFKLNAVYELVEIKGSMRVMNVNLLAGERIIEIHKENGIIYYLDPSTIMFSKGNKNERSKVMEYSSPEKVVVDMFAGIGYYSIPLAKNSKIVHSIEINPESYYYLTLNRYVNRTLNLRPYLMNCNDFPMEDIADLVVMGHFESMQYIEKAISISKNRGLLLIHLLERRGDDMNSQLSQFNLKTRSKRIIKSYSPSINHVVYEAIVGK